MKLFYGHLFLFLIVLLSFSTVVKAQNCDFYFFEKEGLLIEMTHYDKKGKETGKSLQEITDISRTGSSTEAKIHSRLYDKKENLTFETDMKMRCDEKGYSISMENYLASESMAGFRDMDVSIESDELIIPPDMAVGDELPGGTMKVTISGPTTPRMTITISIEDRKVEAKEDITTPAGTFECFKLTYATETQMIMGIKTSSVEWFSPKAGMVKSETYARNGKLMGSTLLTELKK